MAARKSTSQAKRRAIQHQQQAAKYAAKAEHHRKRAAHLGRERLVDRLTLLAQGWLQARGDGGGKRSKAENEKNARLLGNSIAGLAEAGARVLLSGEGEWTPETLGRELGRIAAAAQAAV